MVDDRPLQAQPLRHRWVHSLAAAALLAVFALLATGSAARHDITVDEGSHLLRGYSYLKTGDPRLCVDNPPLVSLLSALPLLLVDDGWQVDLSDANPDWRTADKAAIRAALLPYLELPRTLVLARLPVVALGVLLGLVVLLWVGEACDRTTGLLALGLYAFCPNVIAHASVSTTDLGLTLFVFAASWLTWRFAYRPSWLRLVAVAIAAGCAAMTKGPGLLLLVVLPAVAVATAALEAPRGNRRSATVNGGGPAPPDRPWRRLLTRASATAGAALAGWVVVTALCYGPTPGLVRDLEVSPHRWHKTTAEVHRQLGGGVVADRVVAALEHRPLPAAPYLLGLLRNGLRHRERGHWSYLHGRLSEHGFPAYFPVAIAVKTPLPTLSLGLLGLLLPLLARRWRALRPSCPRPSVALTWLLVPAVFLATTMAWGLCIGLRHVLVIYPFAFAGAATAAAALLRLRSWWSTPLVLGLLSWTAVSAVWRHPHHLEYFNELVGGSSQGYRWLVDSNLDWRQDNRYLRAWEAARGLRLRRNPGCEAVTGWVAVDANHLVGLVDHDPHCYAWTDGALVERVGSVWFIFHLPEPGPPPPRR